MIKKIKKYKIFLFLMLVITIGVFSCLMPNIQAKSIINPPPPTTASFSGYAWSPNIGWIDFSGVSYDLSTGNLSGDAWSPNIGWISFDSITDCPSGTCQPNISLVAGNLTGWGTTWSLQNPNDTETPSDWADGWISLSGSATDGSNYGVSFNPATGSANSNSFAWGGNVIGWINFSDVTIIPISNSDVCPNILGIQTVLPSGMTFDSYGNCIYPGDVCPNLSGIQTSIPSGMTVDSYGNCVFQVIQKTDVCPNILGIQTVLPSGMIFDSNGNCVVPSDYCLNIPGIQTSLPTGMTSDSYGNCTYVGFPFCTVNGVQDVADGETGIDCGGPNCPVCVKLPPNFIEH